MSKRLKQELIPHWPLSEQVMVSLLTHIWFTRPQWVVVHNNDIVLIQWYHLWNRTWIRRKCNSSKLLFEYTGEHFVHAWQVSYTQWHAQPKITTIIVTILWWRWKLPSLLFCISSALIRRDNWDPHAFFKALEISKFPNWTGIEFPHAAVENTPYFPFLCGRMRPDMDRSMVPTPWYRICIDFYEFYSFLWATSTKTKSEFKWLGLG